MESGDGRVRGGGVHGTSEFTVGQVEVHVA